MNAPAPGPDSDAGPALAVDRQVLRRETVAYEDRSELDAAHSLEERGMFFEEPVLSEPIERLLDDGDWQADLVAQTRRRQPDAARHRAGAHNESEQDAKRGERQPRGAGEFLAA